MHSTIHSCTLIWRSMRRPRAQVSSHLDKLTKGNHMAPASSLVARARVTNTTRAWRLFLTAQLHQRSPSRPFYALAPRYVWGYFRECTYACMHHAHVRMYVCMYVCMCVCVCVCVYACMYVCCECVECLWAWIDPTHAYILICAHIHACVVVCTHLHVYESVCVCMHRRLFACMHAYFCACFCVLLIHTNNIT